MEVGLDIEGNQYFSDRRASGKTDFSDKFAIGRQKAPREDTAPKADLQILLDVGSVEMFADGGRVAMTNLFFPNEDLQKVELMVKGGKIMVKKAEIAAMGSIWD